LEIDRGVSRKIAYIGDSITSDRESHMNIVRTILKEYPGIDIKDFAISGYKASDVFTAYYPGIADYAPDIAVIMIGTNDMRITDDEYCYHHGGVSEYIRNINYILGKLHGAGCTPIICTLSPFDMVKMRIALDGWKILYKEESRVIYDNCIIEAAARNEAVLVDMRNIYADYDAADITIDDGLHLNVRGQILLATQIFPRLARLLTD
jgi:lysophospholipase L1-like esterase